MHIRKFLIIALVAAPLAIVGFGSAHAETTRDGAGKFVQGLGDRALEAIANESVTKEQRDKHFREILSEGFDVPAIAAFCMKQYWRKATPEQRDRYVSLFTDLIVQTYSSRLKSIYNGETLSVRQVVADGKNGAMVQSEIKSPNAGDSSVRVDWRVRRPNDDYKIVDVLVEGISMAITQRDEFVAVIQSKGGDIDAFLDTLQEKVAKLESDGV
ncbi:MAG: ABC transporter substrate-binding protein [Rhodospirillaceae bacterium]|jgi:phospholipid transport system substrate-binding protein|nr:ABC transporter substrate-binding protein [Rhodospirillaceae bacterium]